MQEKVSNHNAVGCIPDRVKNPTRMTWERAASTSVCQCQRESGAEVDYAFGAGNRYLSARASITCLRTGSCGSRVLRHGAWIAPSATPVGGEPASSNRACFVETTGAGDVLDPQLWPAQSRETVKDRESPWSSTQPAGTTLPHWRGAEQSPINGWALRFESRGPWSTGRSSFRLRRSTDEPQALCGAGSCKDRTALLTAGTFLEGCKSRVRDTGFA